MNCKNLSPDPPVTATLCEQCFLSPSLWINDDIDLSINIIEYQNIYYGLPPIELRTSIAGIATTGFLLIPRPSISRFVCHWGHWNQRENDCCLPDRGVLKPAGFKLFVLGTLNSGDRDLSTPKKPDIAKFMHAHLEQGGTHFVMEVTSEGIHQKPY
jgi:hypothetical protein